jgi:hypothetical protein
VITVIGLLLALVAVATIEAARVLWSACQFLLKRPDQGRDSSRPSSSPQGDHDLPGRHEPHRHPSRALPPHSSPSLLFFSVPTALSVIDTGPDMSAFTAGLELMVFTVLASIAAVAVLVWILKTMRGSD